MKRYQPGTTLALACTLLFAASFAGTATDPAEIAVPSSADAPPGWRVRADRNAPLDADTGWMAPLSQPATVIADQPFRLRMEVVPGSDLRTVCLRLQYRRNDGEWTWLEAHDFPYPLREVDLTFDIRGAHPVEDWRLVPSDADGLEIAVLENESVLRATAANEPLIGLYDLPWTLPVAFSFATEFRVSAADARATALVFAYVDAANHWRAVFDAAAGRVAIVRVEAGTERVLAEAPAQLSVGDWHEAEVELENGTLELDFDEGAVVLTAAAADIVAVAELGFRVPAGGRVDFRAFAIEGEPSSPRVSIVATEAYANGTPTIDLLPGTALPFSGGSGVSLAECAPVKFAAGHHAELEWPIVIRRFADDAAMNEAGDIFRFRLADSDGRPVSGAPVPQVVLDVPAGHLGGTFVETPGRIGPWQTGNGDLYFVMEPAESDNLFMMVKSSDGGRSWREVDGANRPATGDLESVEGRLAGHTVHLIHQVSESTYYHAFRTSDHPEAPDTWAVTDEPATAVEARAQMASLVVRPDGSIVAFDVGDTIGYAIRSASGSWSERTVMDADGVATAGPQAVLGADGVVHLAYYRLDGTLWHRRLMPDDTLTPAVQLAGGASTREDDFGAVLPLVYLPGSDTVVIVYRLADGRLHERRIRGAAPPTPAVVLSERAVVQNAVDSQQAGADAVGWSGGVLVSFIDATDRSIHAVIDRGDGWGPAVPLVDGILGSWIRGNVYRRADGATVYGYVYDAGSRGGAGMNRYGELVLETSPR